MATQGGDGPLPERFGKYEVESLIAVGGMAEIYLARTPPPVVRRVAVKCIKPAFAVDPEFVGMFVDEARIVAALDHPAIVRILDFEGGERPYLVMEYVDGVDLRTLVDGCAAHGYPFPPWLAAAVLAAAARGLHEAHMARDADGNLLGVVHRDVSPQNVMITRSGLVKVLDFGIARAAGRNTRTKAGVIKGKYAYMAPEQVRGSPVDARTDVFALGTVLYELLTGRNPFHRDRDEATLLAVGDETPPSPDAVQPGVPGELCALTMRALEKAPEARFQTAGAFAGALSEAVARHRTPVTEAHLADFVENVLSAAPPAAAGAVAPGPAAPEASAPGPAAGVAADPDTNAPHAGDAATDPAGRPEAHPGAQVAEAPVDRDASTMIAPRRPTTGPSETRIARVAGRRTTLIAVLLAVGLTLVGAAVGAAVALVRRSQASAPPVSTSQPAEVPGPAAP